MPWATGSTTNMFTHLVWRMLDACETGSTGGDACREGGVLGAAVTEVVNSRGAVKEQFELALGMSLAWYVGRSTWAAPRGPLHGGRSTGVAPQGALHAGVADLFFYSDVRSILMVL